MTRDEGSVERAPIDRTDRPERGRVEPRAPIAVATRRAIVTEARPFEADVRGRGDGVKLLQAF
jgi:hypothetical protein